jgi:hypothetical protein
VCNSTCRAAATSIFVDSVTGNLVVAVPATASTEATTVSIAPEELPGFIGALPCAAGDSCSAYPVAVGTVFEGVYGSGAAVAAAVGSNGRRLQLAQVLVLCVLYAFYSCSSMKTALVLQTLCSTTAPCTLLVLLLHCLMVSVFDGRSVIASLTSI